MTASGINVPIGPATVSYGDTGTETIFNITKGGIKFKVTTNKQDITVDQYGDTPVKSIMKGRTCEVTVPFALADVDKLSKVIPNSTLTTDGTDPTKKKLVVNAQAGTDLLAGAKKLIIKPTDPNATANDWITIPLAGAMADLDYSYDSDNERIVNITFVGYPDTTTGELFVLGDETATV
jgi:hypothetical protein